MLIIFFANIPGVCRNPPTMGLRADLAASTRRAHEALERFIGLGAAPSVERYGWYLRAMHAVVAAAERAMAADARLEPYGLRLAQRRKLAWIEADLRALGLRPLEAAVAPEIPHDVPARIGWAYVLEGSTLGGRVLLEAVTRSSGLAPRDATRFLQGYGERTAAMWREFVQALDAIAFTEPERQACIAGATHAFEAIGEVFRRASVAGAGARIDRQGVGRGLAP